LNEFAAPDIPGGEEFGAERKALRGMHGFACEARSAA